MKNILNKIVEETDLQVQDFIFFDDKMYFRNSQKINLLIDFFENIKENITLSNKEFLIQENGKEYILQTILIEKK